MKKCSHELIVLALAFQAVACSSGSNFNGSSGVKSNQASSSNASQSPVPASSSAPPTADSTPSPASPAAAPAAVLKPNPEYATNPAIQYGSCAAPCSGAVKVIFNSKYQKWVKIVLCTSSRYDLFLGEAQVGPFYKIGDRSGHGQDHCELVNPAFTNPISDDIKSGCPSCDIVHAGSVTILPALFGKSIYDRNHFGDPFSFEAATAVGIHTACWYECGVSF